MANSVPAPDADAAFRVLRRAVTRFIAAFRATSRGASAESVHRFRVTGRRLRIAIAILARKPDGGRMRRLVSRIREATRAAGPCRDIDVSITVLRESGLAPLARVLVAERTHERAKLRRKLGEEASLIDDLLDGLKPGSVPRIRAAARWIAAASRWDRSIRLRLQAIGSRFDPTFLHETRREARRLRYAAEIAAELGFDAAQVEGFATAIQRDLGAINDLVVVADRVARSGESAAAASLRREARRKHRAKLPSFAKVRAASDPTVDSSP